MQKEQGLDLDHKVRSLGREAQASILFGAAQDAVPCSSVAIAAVDLCTADSSILNSHCLYRRMVPS